MEQNNIDEILERVNIIDVIGSYFPLKRLGSNYKARCPFHDEKTASFVVSEKKQIYKCFGCGKAGNAITFVRDYEKISFFEALKKLAKQAGIVLANSHNSKKAPSKTDLIYNIYSLAGAHFQENLRKHGQAAANYLEERDISKETVEKFQIGYALNSQGALKNYLTKNHINAQILEQTGLFTRSHTDLFRERLMFPIHSSTGKIVAFGGRVLYPDQMGGKYINSPTTDIYTKGNELYGLNFTKYEITRKKYALICEGYTDFLRLYDRGFTNVVASLGTALTTQQISLLGRYTTDFFMIYDGDKAGRAAALKAAGNVTRQNFNAKIIDLPLGEDPDSFLQKNDAAVLEDMITNSPSLVQFLFEDSTLGFDKKTKIESLIGIAQESDDVLFRELFLKEVGETFGISESSLFSRIKPKQGKHIRKQEVVELEKNVEERSLLELILSDVSCYKIVAEELDSSYFFSHIYREIFELISEQFDEALQVSGLLDKVKDETVRNVLSELLIHDAREAQMEDIIKAIKVRKVQEDLKTINNKVLQDPGNRELLQQKQTLKKQIMSLNKKVVRKTLY